MLSKVGVNSSTACVLIGPYNVQFIASRSHFFNIFNGHSSKANFIL